MDSKNYTQVLIDGKIYTLGGAEDESYLQRTASYVNEKNNMLRRLPGFTKQSEEYQVAMAELNMADDYFKALDQAREAQRQRDELERESYSIKHELVNSQMKLEAIQDEMDKISQNRRKLEQRARDAERERDEARESERIAREEADEAKRSFLDIPFGLHSPFPFLLNF